MSRPLRVYGGNRAGTHRVIMATTSFKEFDKVARVGRDFGCQTWNEEEVDVAMSHPGVAMARPHNSRSREDWKPL